MRKEFNPNPWFYPLPVLIIGTYDENGAPDAMNAAWGGLYDRDKVVLCLSAPGRFCSFSPNRKCRKMAGKGVQPLDNYTCRFCLSSLKQADKSGLDRLQAGKLAGV